MIYFSQLLIKIHQKFSKNFLKSTSDPEDYIELTCNRSKLKP